MPGGEEVSGRGGVANDISREVSLFLERENADPKPLAWSPHPVGRVVNENSYD